MDYLKKRKLIDKTLVDIYNCKDSDKFYSLCTKLYFNINNIVFNLVQEREENDRICRNNITESNSFNRSVNRF